MSKDDKTVVVEHKTGGTHTISKETYENIFENKKGWNLKK